STPSRILIRTSNRWVICPKESVAVNRNSPTTSANENEKRLISENDIMKPLPQMFIEPLIHFAEKVRQALAILSRELKKRMLTAGYAKQPYRNSGCAERRLHNLRLFKWKRLILVPVHQQRRSGFG